MARCSSTCWAFLWLDQDNWWIAALVAATVVALVALFHYTLLVRLPLWILRHTLYRLRVYGAENIPATGPALLVCNHVGAVAFF